MYLFSDGFTSTLQEKLFKGHKMSMYNQMIYVNGSSALLSVFSKYYHYDIIIVVVLMFECFECNYSFAWYWKIL